MRVLFRIIGRLLALLFILLLMGIAYLHVYGFPPVLIDVVCEQLEQAGVAARFSSIHLEFLRGVVARDARLADANEPQRTLVEIDRVQIHFNPRRLWEGKNMIDSLRIANAVVAVPLPADEEGREYFTARDAYASFEFEDDGTVRIDRLMGEYLGIRLYVYGRFKPKTSRTPASIAPPNFRFLTRVVRELNKIQVNTAPELDLNFEIDMAQPLASQAELRLRGQELNYRGLRFDEANVEIDMRKGAVDIRRCQLDLYGGEISLRGHYDFARSEFDLRLRSTTDLAALTVLVAPQLAEAIRELEVGQNPRVDVRYLLSAETGSRPQLEGEVDLKALQARGVEFEQIKFDFNSQGPVLTVPAALVVMSQGRLNGSGVIHLESSDFAYAFDSTLDPTTLLPLMTPNIREVVEPAWFEDAPHITASVIGDFVDPDNFAYDAVVRARRCSYRGVGLDGAYGDLKLRRSELDVKQLRLERSDGITAGTVRADFNHHQVQFDLKTTGSPRELAPLLGPKVTAVMEPYRFGPRTTAAAKGLVDFEKAEHTAWTASISNAGFGYWKFTAETAAANLVYTNNTFSIKDFKADFYGGELVGAAGFSFAQDPPLYQFRFEARDCDVKGMLDDMQEESQEVSGRLAGRLALYGGGADPAALKGDGNLEIQDGILLQLPLFGIFSRILNEISPGLGQAKATSARATFTLADRAVTTEDLLVEAGAFTLKSSGTVGLDGALDFRVETQILRQVPLLNIASAILGKIFEYKVGGTLSDPNYRPVRFPKEILPHN